MTCNFSNQSDQIYNKMQSESEGFKVYRKNKNNTITLTTVIPKMRMNKSEARPITMTAMSHCGIG